MSDDASRSERERDGERDGEREHFVLGAGERAPGGGDTRERDVCEQRARERDTREQRARAHDAERGAEASAAGGGAGLHGQDDEPGEPVRRGSVGEIVEAHDEAERERAPAERLTAEARDDSPVHAPLRQGRGVNGAEPCRRKK